MNNTLTAKHNENGMVTKTRTIDKNVIRCAHNPGPSSHAVMDKKSKEFINILEWYQFIGINLIQIQPISVLHCILIYSQ